MKVGSLLSIGVLFGVVGIAQSQSVWVEDYRDDQLNSAVGSGSRL
jgi:hypothetical protein